MLSGFGDQYYLDYGARLYDPLIGRWLTIDPLAEKYYSQSPYAYCVNNPVTFVDPTGMDIYRYNNMTGTFHLTLKNNDEFDQVGRFKYDSKTDTYTLQTNRNGEARTRMDNIEKGILSDGINFMKNDNILAVGGEGQASIGGVEAFVVNLSDMVGKEVAGAYFSKDGAKSITHISIGSYENNGFKEAKGQGHTHWNRLYPGSKLENSLVGFFHTHPSNVNINVSDRTQPSGQDKNSRDAALKLMPNLQFYILTHPIYLGGEFPYKISYTKW